MVVENCNKNFGLCGMSFPGYQSMKSSRCYKLRGFTEPYPLKFDDEIVISSSTSNKVINRRI